MQYEAEMVDELIEIIRHKYHEPLRACHPRDVVNQICWSARFENREPKLDKPSLLRAVEAYFVSDVDDAGEQAD
jgi:hypothetical protein